jgi:hypothetical protein
VVGGCIIIDRYMVCFCVYCVCLCLVYFIVFLVFNAYFFIYFVCEFEIVQYIPVIVVCWDLQRMMIGSVRFAG